MIFNGAIEAAKEEGLRIATGAYTGDGKTGDNNPTKISCPFRPRLFVVYAYYNGTSGRTYFASAMWNSLSGVLTGIYYNGELSIGGMGTYASGNFFASKISYDNGTIKIVSADVSAQMNLGKQNYIWIAIG